MDSKSLEKKLSNLKDSTDHIQSMSRWCIQHRSHHHSIVQAWSRSVRKAKVGHRLTLFYVCNDVVQNAKRKRYTDLVQYFGTAVKEAAHLVRDERIKKKVMRIFTIWEDRGVYDKNLINEFISIVEKVGTVENSDKDFVISTFQLPNLVESIRNLVASTKASEDYKKKFEDKEHTMSEESVSQIRLSVKERNSSNASLEEYEQSVSNLENYVANLQLEIDERTKMITQLEQAEIFYETQRGEAKLVATAYKQFTSHLKNLKSKLSEKIDTLPEKVPSPVPSSPLDAPSPEGSDIEELDPQKNLGMSSFMDGSDGPPKLAEAKAKNKSLSDTDHRRRRSSSQTSSSSQKAHGESSYKSNLPETKPMNAKELLDTFGGSYSSKPAPPPSPSSIPFPTSSIPPPPIPRPPIAVLPPLPVPSPFAKLHPPTNLSIPLPPSEPPTGPPTFPPLPPATKPSTPYLPTSSAPTFPPPSLNGTTPPMWMAPPPPPPLPTPTTSASSYWPPYEETTGDEPPDEEEDEDAMNWGEPPGIEELQTYHALKEAEAAGIEDKDVSFLVAPPPPPPASFSFDKGNDSGDHSNLVSIERSSVNYNCYDYTKLVKPMTDAELFPGDDTDLRVKKKGVTQNEDSGSDMDISEGEASDNEKGRKSKRTIHKISSEKHSSPTPSKYTSMLPPTTVEEKLSPPDLAFLKNPLLENLDAKAISQALSQVSANNTPVAESLSETVVAFQKDQPPPPSKGNTVCKDTPPPPPPEGMTQLIESFVTDGSSKYKSPNDTNQSWDDPKELPSPTVLPSPQFDGRPEPNWFSDEPPASQPITPLGSGPPNAFKSPGYNMDQGYRPPPFRGNPRGRRNSFEPRGPFERFPQRPRGFPGFRGRGSFGSPNGPRWNNHGGHARW